MNGIGGFVLAVLGAGVCFWIIAGHQISLLLALREIRKMAETLPQDKREDWLNSALNSMNDGIARETK